MHRIDFQIVLGETVNDLKICSSLSRAPVFSFPLPTLQFMKRTVDANKEYVHFSEKTHQIRHPPLILDDVVDKIVAGLGKTGRHR